jgi:hypothetical protein
MMARSSIAEAFNEMIPVTPPTSGLMVRLTSVILSRDMERFPFDPSLDKKEVTIPLLPAGQAI